MAKTPRGLRKLVLRFEAVIEERVEEFAKSLPDQTRVLDAGAGELQYSWLFPHCRYTSIDLGVGDVAWDYTRLDVCGDLAKMPFRNDTFEAAINIVVLEHTREPHLVTKDIGRVTRPGGQLLIIVPQEWAMHQLPHDYFRYTRPGLEMLLRNAGFGELDVQPIGGFFTLLGRRILDSVLFFQGSWRWLLLPFVALLAAPIGILLPFLDFLDKDKNTTLGWVCLARKAEQAA